MEYCAQKERYFCYKRFVFDYDLIVFCSAVRSYYDEHNKQYIIRTFMTVFFKFLLTEKTPVNSKKLAFAVVVFSFL